jgi:putative ABC transport system permease protein
MLRDLLDDAARDIRAHWLRVLLTGSGIVWGIALFVTMMAWGTSVRAHYREKMEAIGRKVIYAFPGSVAREGTAERAVRAVVLKRDDPPRVSASPLVEHAAGEMWNGPRVLKGGGHIKVVWTYGVGADVGRIRNFEVARGRFVTPADVAERRRVLVVGAKVEQRLFGRRSALGRTVRLEGFPFRIVGVSTPKGQQMINMGPNDDEQVLLPLSTAQTLFSGNREVGWVLYEPRTTEDGAASTERVRTILGRHHHFTPRQDQALAFFNIRDAIRLIEMIGVGLQIFLAACGILTLVVGGVGVMNIMLVAVTERTRELGLRKALGATQRDLFVGLLLETVLITVSAGILGLGLGAGLVGLLSVGRQAPAKMAFLVPHVTVSPALAATSFVVLVAVGLLAGLVPAQRAARLDPAAALREE